MPNRDARPRYPFIGLGAPLVLILLFAYGPMVILLASGMVAGALGCAMPLDGTAPPCLLMGFDLRTFLAFGVACGFFSFLTIPLGTPLLGVWLVAAVITTLVWGLRRRRANASG